MVRNLLVLAAATSFVTLGMGCEKKDDAGKAKDATTSLTDSLKDTANKAVDSAKTEASKVIDKAKQELVDQGQKALDGAKGEFEKLKGMAGKIPENMKPEFDKAIASIESQFGGLSTKLESLKTAGADAWKKIGDEFSPALKKLQEELTAAVSKFGATAK